MATLAVHVQNADRMMTRATAHQDGIEVEFADGRRGTVPFDAIAGVVRLEDLKGIELPNAYEIILKASDGQETELPWDFVRHYCDPEYRPQVERAAAAGRRSLGARLRQLRAESGMTQEALAKAAGIGRVTLVRIEKGEQSPRYETLVALAGAMKLDASKLFLA